jgi:dimethylhistidine N-methyltransferase
VSDALLAERVVLEDFAAAVRAGMARSPREIPARYLYDRGGSELFEQITYLPEYYPTRTEISLIQRHSAAIAERVGTQRTVVEFGSGSSAKTPPFLNAVGARAYVPVDISAHFLESAARNVRAAVPGVEVYPLPGDFTHRLDLPDEVAGDPKLGFFPGSTIGNMSTFEAVDVLRAFRETLGDDAHLVIGVDLKKDIGTLEAAYADSQGITAEFILGILRRMQEDLSADLDVEDWEYHSFWNAEMGRIEMHVRAVRPTTIDLDNGHWTFAEGDTIHISNSHKYTLEESALLARCAGFRQVEAWTDPERLFSLQLWRALPDDLDWQAGR